MWIHFVDFDFDQNIIYESCEGWIIYEGWIELILKIIILFTQELLLICFHFR